MKSTCPKKQEVEVQEMVDIAKLRLIVEILPSIVSRQPVEANGGKLKYISSNLVKSKVFKKQVSCNASVWKTYFIQFCVQRLHECYFDLFYLKLLLGKLSPNLWTKNTDFYYILLGF